MKIMVSTHIANKTLIIIACYTHHADFASER